MTPTATFVWLDQSKNGRVGAWIGPATTGKPKFLGTVRDNTIPDSPAGEISSR